jgi:Lamin Tail Domain
VTISEVAPWASGNTTYAADWFEVTNTGTTDIDITGWKIDDNSNAFASAVALRGLSILPAGKSAIFLEGTATGTTDATIVANFSTAWFGSATPPTNVLIGTYGGPGVGLSTGSDAVNLFDATGDRVAGVSFGPSTAGITFDNTAGLNGTTLPLPIISTLSVVGANGALSRQHQSCSLICCPEQSGQHLGRKYQYRNRHQSCRCGHHRRWTGHQRP